MRPHKHIFYGAIFSVLIYLIFPGIKLGGLLILFLSTFLIDIDHYTYYVLKKRDLNPIRAFKWHMENFRKYHSLPEEERKNFFGGLYMFHGMEFLIILFIVGVFLYKPIVLVFIGFLFHLFLDLYAEFCYKGRTIKLSFIIDFINARKLKNIDEV